VKKILHYCLILMLSQFSLSLADIDSILDKTINTTTTSAGVYKSPSMTTGTLGSYSFRLKTDLLDLPVFTLQPPRATISCSGFDFDAGFISLLNLDTFQSMLEQAGTSLSWGVVIGLIYSIPGIAQAFQYLNEFGRYSQMLGQGACQIGTSLGKSVGSSIFYSAKVEGEGNAVASGIKSTFEEAVKNYKNYLKIERLFYTFPYTYLKSSGFSDEELQNMIAGFFGIYDWKPYKEDGSICQSRDCIDGKNIKTLAKPPKIDTLDALLYGGNVKVYTCSWNSISVDGTIINACTAFNEANINIQEGLIEKVYKRIDRIVDDLINGNVVSPDDAAFLQSYGWLTNVINALVLMKRINPTNYKPYAYAVAQRIALTILKSLIYSARAELIANVYANMIDKASKDAMDEIFKRFVEANKEINRRFSEIQDDIKMLDSLNQLYFSLKSGLDEQLRQKFGSYIFIQR